MNATTGKNLIVFCDGTNNEFGDTNTNVVRTYWVATRDHLRQRTYYVPGVGTAPAPGAITTTTKKLTKLAGSAVGYGLSDNVACSYKFLMENYEDGDRIYLFGFSRGAYTVRALAALIHACGLLNVYSDNLVSYAWNLFRKESDKNGGKKARTLLLPLCSQFADTFSRRVPVHFIGVWDTVSSVGGLYNPFKLPYTKTNPSVAFVRHAISIDERRKFFRTNLWSEPSPTNRTDVVQVWFAGVHADVGGGYPEAESGLSKISLEWMLGEAQKAGMLVDPAKLPSILPPATAVPPPAPASPTAEMHDELNHAFWIAMQTMPREAARQDPKTGEWTTYTNLSPIPQSRPIAAGSRIHHTVFERMKLDPNYRPVNVPKIRCDETGTPVP